MKVTPIAEPAIIRLTGAIRPQQAYELEAAMEAQMKTGHYKLIIDLSDADHLTSSALGILAGAAEVCRRNGGELRLVVVDGEILKLLKLTMLDKIFDTYESVAEAGEDF